MNLLEALQKIKANGFVVHTKSKNEEFVAYTYLRGLHGVVSLVGGSKLVIDGKQYMVPSHCAINPKDGVVLVKLIWDKEEKYRLVRDAGSVEVEQALRDEWELCATLDLGPE